MSKKVEISKNQSEQIHYRNKEELEKKILQIKKDGLNNLAIMMDYDRSISPHNSDTTFNCVRKSKYVP